MIQFLKTTWIAAMALTGAVNVHAATEVTQYGITWTFNADYTVGQFVNGDYYVVDPGSGVVVNSVTPTAAEGKHGSMVNPGLNSHAWDNRLTTGYNSALNATFPLTLAAGQSHVKVVSILDEERVPPTASGEYTTTWNGSTSATYKLKTMAVLTCLAAAPPAQTFRPPYIGTTKPLYQYSSVNQDWFPNLPRPILLVDSDIIFVERGLQRPWLINMFLDSAQDSHPVENQLGYHRDIGGMVGRAALIVCTDAASEALKINFIQLGIDYYGLTIQPTGHGDSSHWRWPTIFAGCVLNEPAMYHVYSNGGFRGTPRDRSKFYYVKDGTSNLLSSVVTGNDVKPFDQTWYGTRAGFRKGSGNEEHEHLDPSDPNAPLVASGGWTKMDSYRWCCDVFPNIGNMMAAVIVSRNPTRPSISAGTGGSIYANTPIKCFYSAGESFDGTDTEEFSFFDFMFAFQNVTPPEGRSNTLSSFLNEMWVLYVQPLMSETEYTIEPLGSIDPETPPPDPPSTGDARARRLGRGAGRMLPQ